MPSVSEFLIERLNNNSVKHVFGLPGDYVLNLYKKISNSSINLINVTDENNAGFAADAYARIQGIGCVCVTYNVGALKVANAIACAYAERSPVILISGSPGLKERKEGVLLHHMVRSFDCQKHIFENITCASTILDNPAKAGYEIDRVFECLHHHKQPIYIELPRDVAETPIGYDMDLLTPKRPQSDQQNLQEAIEEIENWLTIAKKPVILAGVQLARFNLGNEILKFAERLNIPIATTILSKSVINEQHPLFLGIYAGNASKAEVKESVEESDCLMMLGVLLTDMNFSFMPIKFGKRQTVYCSVEEFNVKNHTYSGVVFEDFIKKLVKINVPKKQVELPKKSNVPKFIAQEVRITSARLFEKINSILTDDMVILADVGDALFGAIDLQIHNKNYFLSPAFYTTMGFAIPGGLGAQMARPNSRLLVLTGDGSFQMSCTELSSYVKYGINPIIFVLNNGGYITERFLIDGKFNDVHNWCYHEGTRMFGGGNGYLVLNEIELETAIESALQSKEMSIINIILDKDDTSPALKRMTSNLKTKC